ncbi:MAG: carbohydrate porin [Steroidobacteraceae bacterium]
MTSTLAGRDRPWWLAATLLGCAAVAADARQQPPVPASDQQADPPWALLAATYTADAWRVARGAGSPGYVWVDNLDLVATVDGEQLAGIHGLELHAHAIYSGGGSVSARTGDAQGPSNIEAPQALRLLEFWADWRPGGSNRHSLRTGLYDLNSEFDALPSAALFLHSSQGIGADLGLSGQNGPSIFPVTGLALRYRHEAGNGLTLLAAVIDGVPGDPDKPRRTTLRLSSAEGLLGIVELSFARARLTKLAAGAWHYSATFDELLATDTAGNALRSRRNRGAYAHLEYALGTPSGDGVATTSAYLRVGRANPDINRFGAYLGAGLVLRGRLLDRDDRRDEFGIGIAQVRNGGPWRALAAASGGGATRAETAIELTWRIPVNDWLTLQPDLQWIHDPDTDPSRSDALAAALRFELSVERAVTRAGVRR